jgi:drug/metabolite transporter (DMT)-like permease
MDTTLTHRAQPSQALVIAAFAAIYLIWGSTYIAILFAIKDIPVLMMTGIRFMTAGLILLIYSLSRGQSLPDIRSIGKISLSGILMLFFGTGSVAYVEQYIPSGLAAIIVATVPLWFVLLDKQQWKFNFSNKWIISGLLVGFAGVLTLFADKGSFSLSGDKTKLISFFILLAGTISWAGGSLYAKYKAVEAPASMKAAIQMLVAGLFSLLASAISGEFRGFVLSQVSTESIAALLYLILVGSLVGYMAYVWLLSVKPPVLVGTYAYVNPVVAVFLGWLIAHEQISNQQIIALMVILAGVILVTLSKEKKQ